MNFFKPPIIEAIFYVEVQRQSNFTLDSLSAYRNSIIDQFPHVELKVFQKIPFNSFGIQSVETENHGYRLTSLDNKKIVNINIDDFSFSQLEPYSNWDTFFLESYHLWEKYAELTNVNKITKLSLRYLNRILIPFHQEDSVLLEDYVRIFPQLPEELSMSISKYVMQVSLLSDRYSPSQSIVSQTTSELITDQDDNDFIPIIFDIVVYQNVDFTLDNSNLIQDIFCSNLRNFKNEIFSQAITEKSQKLLEVF